MTFLTGGLCTRNTRSHTVELVVDQLIPLSEMTTSESVTNDGSSDESESRSREETVSSLISSTIRSDPAVALGSGHGLRVLISNPRREGSQAVSRPFVSFTSQPEYRRAKWRRAREREQLGLGKKT